MKNGTHPSPRQRLFVTVASAALSLLVFAAYLIPLSSAAQNPFAHKGLCDTDPITQPCGDQGFNSCGQIFFYPWPGGITTTLSLTDTMLYTNTPEYTDTCMAPFKFSWSRHDAPVGNSSGTDVSKYPTMRGGPGSHTFYITFGRQATTWVEEDWLVLSRFPNDINIYFSGTQRVVNWDLFVDGVQSGTVEPVPGTQEYSYSGYNTYDGHPYLFVKGVWKVTYTPSSAYGLPNNVREFALRPKIQYTLNGIQESISNEEFRFKAVMVGSEAVAGTEDGEYGTFDTPLVPNMILHDPPGDGSFTSLESTQETCTGLSYSVAFDNSNDNFFNVRLGYSGSVGVAVEVDLEIWAEFSTTMNAGITNTEAEDYQTCFSTITTIETPEEGLPDDQFFATAIRYQYGWVKTVARSGCSAPLDTAQFVAKPIDALSSVQYSESYLRGVLVPGLQVQVATLVQGTPAWQGASDQLEVWEQALALNDSIKANAELDIFRNIQAPSSNDYGLTTTTETSRSIDCNVYLERGLNFEAGFSIAGNGLSGGYGVRFRQEIGKVSSTSSAQTNTLSYTLADGSEGDYINVEVRKDPVFGHPVFNTIPGTAPFNTQTSCPYEGGYQRQQPSLSVGSLGSNFMAVNEVPFGQSVAYPLYVCNNSLDTMNYYLKFRNNTNTEGAILSAFGNTINANDDGIYLEDLLPDECLDVTNLLLTQPQTPLGPDYSIEVYLYSLCEPTIRSSVIIEAHFGAGNFGSVCVPTSDSAATSGDWIDGVQVQAIDNTGTGGPSSGAYTDYSAQFSAPLSRNAQRVITLTGGAHFPDRYAVWIDYDHSGSFEAGEKLAADAVTSAPFQSISVPFTVPGNATLGSTLMRVRGARENADLDPCFSYTYGETEDYAVVINSNTPQDCAGVNNGPALPGTACSDGNANTGNDTWNANCTCVGQVIDCAGVPGGTTTSGSPCDDGNANTDGDVYGANCQCAGLALDCLGVPGGTTVQGTACDDGDAATGNDLYNASCQCTGQLIDCLGVIGGATTVGTPCDDGNPLSSGDAYAANCECAGEVTDCEGTAGGPVLPGTPCDDGLACTANDVRGADCACSGTTITIGAVTGSTMVIGNTSNAFVISPIANATSYTWELPNGWSTSDNGAFVLLAEANNTAGPVQLCVTVMVGDCELTSCLTVNVDFNTGITTNEANADDWFTVQPNPSNGIFQLRPSTTDAVPLRISIRNGLGQEVLAPFTVAGQRAIDMDLSDVASGAYYLLATRNGEQQLIKIMVQR